VSHSKKKTVGAALAILGLGLGAPVGAATVTVSSQDEIQVHAGDRVVEAKIAGDKLFGAQVQVQRYGSELRGRAFNTAVQLEFNPGKVTGQVGSRPVNLQVRQNGDGVDVNGLFAGNLSNLRIRPTALSGRMGRCDYDLTLAGTHYEGWRRCDGEGVPVPASLQLPEALASLSDSEQVAILGLVLSGR